MVVGEDQKQPWAPLLRAAEGLPVVLVGGHAALAWAAVYGVEHGATTTDLDWHTTDRNAVRTYVERLTGTPTLRESTDGGFHLAVVRAVDGAGVDRTVDFISGVHGVAHNEGLEKRALVLELGGCRLKVLHPVHVQCSKFANLSLPNRGDPMDVAQAEIATKVVERFTQSLAEKDPRAARAVAKRVLELARGPAGRAAREKHGLDAFAAIQPWPTMDPDFRERFYPQTRQALDAAFERRLNPKRPG